MIAAEQVRYIANRKVLMAGCVIIYLLTMLLALHDYVPYQSANFLLGTIAIPAIIITSPVKNTSYRFIVPAMLCATLTFFLPEKTFLFLALAFALLSAIESINGRLPLSALMAMLFMSPALQYLAGVFSFPIRMKLTEIAGRLFNIGGMHATVAGNTITMNGHEYTVDPACMGLKMLITSMICGLIIIATVQHKSGKQIRTGHFLLMLTVLFILNIISNIFRILLLVYFNIPPESMMHDVTGLVCLSAYVLLPAIGLVTLLVKKYGTPSTTTLRGEINTRKALLLQTTIFLLILSTILIPHRKSQSATPQLRPIAGYAASRYDSQVLQYKNERSLIYVKHIAGFYTADHNPLICWLGSGYVFELLNESTVNNTAIYTGILKKGKDILYTAWWYDNGVNRTLNQLEWRWDRLKGANDYSVINVTALSREHLEQEIYSITRQNIFNTAL